MREGEDANRTRVAGHLDEIQGVVANTLKLFREGAVGFIGWLDLITSHGFPSVIVVSLINHIPIPFNRHEVDVVMTGIFI